MKKLKFILLFNAMMALSVGGFVNSQIENGIELQSIEQLMAFNKAVAGDESGGGNYTCSSGGPGSTSCSVGVEGAGYGSYCEVTCTSGYYACCNSYVNKCQCRLY